MAGELLSTIASGLKPLKPTISKARKPKAKAGKVVKVIWLNAVTGRKA